MCFYDCKTNFRVIFKKYKNTTIKWGNMEHWAKIEHSCDGQTVIYFNILTLISIFINLFCDFLMFALYC